MAQDQSFHVVDSWPVDEARILASLDLDGWARGLFLSGDVAVVLLDDWEWSEDFDTWGQTKAVWVDVSDGTHPVVTRTAEIAGWLTDARMVDGQIYLVMNHNLALPQEVWHLAWDEDLDLPELDWNLTGDEWEAARRCDDLYRPADPAQSAILSVVRLPTAEGDLAATGVLSSGWTVYASTSNLYVAQTSWWSWWGLDDLDMNTHIHKFALNGEGEPSYLGSGEVSGWVYDQFAMSEYEGFLRVATSDFDWWWGAAESEEDEPANNVYVLEDDGDGELDVVGALRGLAPGEQIQAARMLEDRGYLVTFQQVDPLFTIDLSDPYNPVAVGELKVPGYSAYLHPMDANHLLSVGMDGEEDGTLTGLSFSIFDVSDFANPVEDFRYTLDGGGSSWSEAMWDHHAFTYHRGVLSVPVYTWDWDSASGEYDYFSGLVVLSVDARKGFVNLGSVEHRSLVTDSECLYERWYEWEADVCDEGGYYWYASVRRSLYLEDKLYSLSDYGLLVNELNDPEVELARLLFYPAE